jgi:hypothetical protein
MQKSKKRGEEENKQTGKLNRDEILRAYTIQQQKIWEAQRRSLTSSIPPKPDRPDDKRLLQKLKIERSEVERQQRIRARYEEEQAGFQIGSDRKLRITRQVCRLTHALVIEPFCRTLTESSRVIEKGWLV